MFVKINILLFVTTLLYANKIPIEAICDNGMIYYKGQCREIIIDPYFDNAEESAKNMLQTKPNCADNEQALQSEDVWKCYTVVKEDNCPEGQWIDGKCEPWPSNVVTIPPNCPPGQQWVNGKCVDIWPQNIVTVPPNCPPGQVWVGGQCVEVWPQNIVTVPPNCPPGQVWVGGQCRDIWRMDNSDSCTNGVMLHGECVPVWSILKKILRGASAKPIQDDIVMDAEVTNDLQDGDVDTRRVVNVPNQCPVGFRPDANGVCRPLF